MCEPPRGYFSDISLNRILPSRRGFQVSLVVIP
jgi:hypothetical protein